MRAHRVGTALGAALAALLTVSACAPAAQSSGQAPAGQQEGGTRAGTISDLAAVPAPTAHLAGPDRIRATAPVVIVAAHGTISGVSLTGANSNVHGHLVDSGRRWRSTGLVTPATRYAATVHLHGADGTPATQTLHLRTRKPARTLTMTATPGPGATVGIGEPIAVTFSSPVPHRAAVERHMRVTTSRGVLEGSWHWFSPTVAHYRPQHLWPGHTHIHVHIDIAGVYAGKGLWGDRDHDWSWKVGEARVSVVNAAKHTFTVSVDGKRVHRWPTGTGQSGFATRSGVYQVLAKAASIRMTSCSVGISCTPGSSAYYDMDISWATRLTDSGTFVHAAPWDTELGRANTSHGCIHLSTTDAEQFYTEAKPGDVVIVRHSGRPTHLRHDHGMMDWNMSWAQWQAGSALAGR